MDSQSEGGVLLGVSPPTVQMNPALKFAQDVFAGTCGAPSSTKIASSAIGIIFLTQCSFRMRGIWFEPAHLAIAPVPRSRRASRWVCCDEHVQNEFNIVKLLHVSARSVANFLGMILV